MCTNDNVVKHLPIHTDAQKLLNVFMHARPVDGDATL